MSTNRMNVLGPCLLLVLGSPLVVCAGAARTVEAQPKPNIVLLYIDDWAWNGSPVAMDDGMPNSRMPVVEMPNVERLAREGMRFRNAYASPQCSPGRVCIQTGQSSPRNGFTVFMNDKGQEYYDAKSYRAFPVVPCISDMTIDPDAVTIPEALKPLGYESAHIGKWHMRGDPGDEGYVLHDGDTSNKPGNTLVANLAAGESKPKRLPPDLSDPKLMFSVTEKAIGFIEEQVEKEQPFYVQISHYAMHAGSECLPATRDKYAKHPLVRAWYEANDKDADTVRIGDDPAVWLGMAENLDGRIGAVLDRLDELGIADETYVVLVADNGYRHEELGLKPGLTQPHHATKWWVWQGGIRVPMIVRGPGIEAGSKFHGNVVNYDLLPTLVDWAGGNPTELANVDGVSLAPYMAGRRPDEAFLQRRLYFHYPHYRTTMPHSAIVAGSRKVIHFYERPDLPMLFDLAKDPGEVHNLAGDHPREHARLHREMMDYLESVGARMPKPNPDYDPAKYRAAKEFEKRTTWGPFEGRRPLDEDERPSDGTETSQTEGPPAVGERPNVVLILADDLGYGDLACYGADDIATPHIDRMAAEGAKFTSFYVAPVCSPTRAALMTGCYSQRVGIGGVLFPRNDHGLNPDETTLPELLKERGYAKQFGGWLVRNERLPVNPFVSVQTLNAETDVRRERRELSATDLAKLLAAANAGQPFCGLSGRDRVMLYLVASNAGLRARELSNLERDNLDLDGTPPTITVAAAYSKNRKLAVQPIRDDLAIALGEWLDERGDVSPAAPLWPGTWHQRAAAMLRRDLESAGLSYFDDRGRVFDFHALRHQFISNLAAAGVHSSWPVTRRSR